MTPEMMRTHYGARVRWAALIHFGCVLLMAASVIALLVLANDLPATPLPLPDHSHGN